MFSGCLTIDCLRSFCLVKSRGFAHLAPLGLISMMLHNNVTVNTVALQECTRQAAVKRQDSSCTYLAHHELESVQILYSNIIIFINNELPFLCSQHPAGYL